MLNKILKAFSRFLPSRIWRDEQGVAVTETALALPLMLIILSGTVEVANYLLLNIKSQHTVVAIGDLLTRDQTLSADVVADSYEAIEEIMAPYPVDRESRIIVTAFSLAGPSTPTTLPTIIWQCVDPVTDVTEVSEYGVHRQIVDFTNEGITMRLGETLVVTEFFYQYKPLVFQNVISPRLLRRKAYFRPRIGALDTVTAPLTPEGVAAGCLSS